ncbi:conserved hypothetical protein [delta proteobacterium NaphS2]|nr:conserved hypothetical protein [delta proteobacterium NaphS2]
MLYFLNANTSITRFAQSVVSEANETAGKVGSMHLLTPDFHR